MAKKSMIAKSKRPPRYPRAAAQSLRALWTSPRVYSQVRPVPNLLPRAGAQGAASGRDQGELVGGDEHLNTTDPIADMLTRVRNAIQARHAAVDMPFSKMKLAIAKIMEQEGYISRLRHTPRRATANYYACS